MWRDNDREFASLWDEAMETAVDAVESALYQKALSGDTVPMIFYPKAHRPKYHERLTIDLQQVQKQLEERLARLNKKLPSNGSAGFTIKDFLTESIDAEYNSQ